MTTAVELSLSAVNQKRHHNGGATPPLVDAIEVIETSSIAESSGGTLTHQSHAADAGTGESAAAKLLQLLPFDPFRAVDALWKNVLSCTLCGSVLAAIMLIAAKMRVEAHYTATAQLVKQAMPDSFRASQIGEAYKPADIPVPILTSNLMRGRALLDRVGRITNPLMTAPDLLKGLTVTTDKKTEVISVSYTSDVSAARAVEVISRYADEVVKFTKEMQAQDAAGVNEFLKRQLLRCDADLVLVNEELLAYAKESDLLDGDKEMDAYLAERANMDLKYEATRLDHETLDLKLQSVEKELIKVSPAAARLQKAQEELAQLLARYTEQNPVVEEQRDRIKSLEEEMKRGDVQDTAPPQAGESPVAASLYLQRVDLLAQKGVMAEQLKKLDEVRTRLTDKLNQLPRKNLEYALIKARRQSLDAARQLLASRQREAELFMDNSLGYYRVLQGARSEDAVFDSRSSKKMLYGGAGFAMGFLALAAWFVFRELSDGRVRTAADLRRVTRLPVLASLPADVGRDKAAQEAWAFRTWTRLQSQLKHPDAALVCGLLAEHETGHCAVLAHLLADAAAWRGAAAIVITTRPPVDRPVMPLAQALTRSLNDADRWLATGNGVVFLHADELWTWNAAQRSQLSSALNQWSRHGQALVFVELPPASQPETLLMAEHLPQLLWVGASGQTPGAALGEVLATYRHAGCKLLGAMFNQAPRLKPSILNQFISTTALVALVTVMMPAQESTPRPQAPAAVAGSAKPLTLGPGDSVNLMMFGRPETARNEVALKPDGRITFMEAQDIMAAGLTVDGLREKLNDELSKYHQRPRVMVTPASFQSRKVYVLGKVVKKGMVNLDRPLTLLEAITEAGGLETGLFQQNTVELADLGRSFLSRRGERVKVDFEALFSRGDMSQNVPLEPDDYIYFPSANNNEIYVVGNVRSQGAQGLLGHSSVTSVVALAGGFTTKAYRDRVLVIRGSLEQPQAFAVDMNAILSGREKGFKLEPNDIVYVADKPWARAEELLDMALTTFIQGAVSGYTSGAVGPLITKPLFNAARGGAE